MVIGGELKRSDNEFTFSWKSRAPAATWLGFKARQVGDRTRLYVSVVNHMLSSLSHRERLTMSRRVSYGKQSNVQIVQYRADLA